MKKLFFGFVLAVCGFSMPLLTAQDYCCPPPCDPCCMDPGFDGFYIGGNIGVHTHEPHRNDLDGHLTNAGWTVKNTDLTLGVQVGYDWVCCNKLFGLVVDWNWVNVDGRFRHEPNSASTNEFVNNEFDWFTTIRARAGITFCDSLVYVTLGAAVAQFDTRWGANAGQVHYSDTRWGWVGGVGTEMFVWCNWTLGVELLFLHFDDHVNTSTIGSTSFSFGHSDNAYVGRILLNYRFGDLCSFCCW